MAFIRVDWPVDADPEQIAAIIRRIGMDIEERNAKKDVNPKN